MLKYILLIFSVSLTPFAYAQVSDEATTAWHQTVKEEIPKINQDPISFLSEKLKLHRVVLLSEGTHRVKENEGLIQAALPTLYQQGLRILALEAGVTRQEWVQKYLNGEIDEEKFKDDIFKTEWSQYEINGIKYTRQDFFPSNERVEIIKTVKTFNAQENIKDDPIHILLIDNDSSLRYWGLTPEITVNMNSLVFRGMYMANRLLLKLREMPQAKAIVLCGNVHGIKNLLYDSEGSVLELFADQLLQTLNQAVYSIYLYNNTSQYDKPIHILIKDLELKHLGVDLHSSHFGSLEYDIGGGTGLFHGAEAPYRVLFKYISQFQREIVREENYMPVFRDLYDGIIAYFPEGLFHVHTYDDRVEESLKNALIQKSKDLNINQ